MVTVGILRDHPTAGGDGFARVVRQGFDDVRALGRLAHDVDLVEEHADGLPRGTREAVESAFRRLSARGVVAIIGPAISDNGLVVRDLADAERLPCLNWTGGEETRSEWMFHYQVGSLEEEPAFLAMHVAGRGHRRVRLVSDGSLVGRRYVEFFADAAARWRLQVGDDRPDAIVYLGLWDGAHALASSAPTVPVFANSALMYGHVSPDWRRDWNGWSYVDAYSDRNALLADMRARTGDVVAPVTTAAAYDMGRLIAEGIGPVAAPDRASVMRGLERVKVVPSALGTPGTTMGFGRWERAALKGGYLVLRTWRDGVSVEA